jgi:hypothetical protein
MSEPTRHKMGPLMALKGRCAQHVAWSLPVRAPSIVARKGLIKRRVGKIYRSNSGK